MKHSILPQSFDLSKLVQGYFAWLIFKGENSTYLISWHVPLASPCIWMLVNQFVPDFMAGMSRLYSLNDLDLYWRAHGFGKAGTCFKFVCLLLFFFGFFFFVLFCFNVAWSTLTQMFVIFDMQGRWLQRNFVSMANMDHLSICSSCYFNLWEFSVIKCW